MKTHLSASSVRDGHHPKVWVAFLSSQRQAPTASSLVDSLISGPGPGGQQHSHDHDRRNQMTRKKKGVTRRRFLEQVGLAGGSAAMYETMTALGLIRLPEAWAGPPELPQRSGAGKSGLILGARTGGEDPRPEPYPPKIRRPQ